MIDESQQESVEEMVEEPKRGSWRVSKWLLFLSLFFNVQLILLVVLMGAMLAHKGFTVEWVVEEVERMVASLNQEDENQASNNERPYQVNEESEEKKES